MKPGNKLTIEANDTFPSVKKVTAGNSYQLTIEFDNVEAGILDMKPFLETGVFKK